MRVALLLEYQGADYFGSQAQNVAGKALPTVQTALEHAIARLSLSSSAVILAGRTDAGVHALGQVAHFTISHEQLANIPDLRLALNAVLPATIRVKNCRLDVPEAFHSRASATARWYRYIIFNRRDPSPFAPVNSTWIKTPLDVDKMNAAAGFLLGEHNFQSFKCPDTPVKYDICHVYAAEAFCKEAGYIVFDIIADRFLYKMVRNLMGVLVTIGRMDHSFPPELIQDVLFRQDRYYAGQIGPIAKAEGLTLVAIQYPALYNFFSSDENVDILSQRLKRLNIMTESLQDENVFRKAS